MPLFDIGKRKAQRIKSLGVIKPEDKLHKLIEGNLGIFFPSLVLIKHKPSYDNKEFDTLAFDKEISAPVIFEFKVSHNRSVSDQVDSYLTIMLANKELIKYQVKEVLPNVKDINFDQARIVIIANEFSDVQINALSLRTHYVEMWKYNQYEGFLLLENITAKKISGAKSFAKQVAPKVDKEIVQYEDITHFRTSANTRKIYENLHQELMDMDKNMQRKINMHFIGYKSGGFYFCCIKPKASFVKVELKIRKIPETQVFKVQKIPSYRHTPMDHVFKISELEQIPSAIKILKQAHEDSL